MSILNLRVAGIGISIVCHQPDLLGQMVSRYQEFLTDHREKFTVTIEASPGDSKGLLSEATPIFSSTTVRIEGDEYRGNIDLTNQAAELSISTCTPFEDVDYFIRLIYALLSFRAGGFMFHSAGIVRGGVAYLYFGHSGSGKTTVSRLSTNDIVLNDDLVILQPKAGNWYAFSTPFWHPDQMKPTRTNAPVGGLFLLVKNSTLSLSQMSHGRALSEVISNIPVISADRERSEELIIRCTKVLTQIPAFALHFLPDESFWIPVEQEIVSRN